MSYILMHTPTGIVYRVYDSYGEIPQEGHNSRAVVEALSVDVRMCQRWCVHLRRGTDASTCMHVWVTRMCGSHTLVIAVRIMLQMVTHSDNTACSTHSLK